MNYLIDTNVISELVSVKPNVNVITWLSNIPLDYTFLSVLTLGEIRKGIESIKNSKRKIKLIFWLEQDLLKKFEENIVPISIDIADRWGRLLNEVNRSLPAIDSLIAATALHHDMTLVTRNIADFVSCPGIKIFNPWDEFK